MDVGIQNAELVNALQNQRKLAADDQNLWIWCQALDFEKVKLGSSNFKQLGLFWCQAP